MQEARPEIKKKLLWKLRWETVKREKNKKEIVENVGVDPSLIASKGPNYNKYIVDFINRIWNPEAARQKSDSLDRMIRRIEGI